MGNRTSLILCKENSKRKLILEANNQLPFFWVLLLDVNTIEKGESKFIKCFESQIETCEGNFKINKEDLNKNTLVAKDYIKKFQPEITSKYEQFSEYLKSIISENFIEIDFIEIANFYSSPTDLLTEIKNTLKSVERMTSLDKKYLAEYIANTSFFYLVGYDDYANIESKFSTFSQEYNQLQKNLAIQKKTQKGNKEEEETKKQEKIVGWKKEVRRFKIKRILYAFSLCVFGLLILIVHLVKIAYEHQKEIRNGVVGAVIGTLILIYGYHKLRKAFTKTPIISLSPAGKLKIE